MCVLIKILIYNETTSKMMEEGNYEKKIYYLVSCIISFVMLTSYLPVAFADDAFRYDENYVSSQLMDYVMLSKEAELISRFDDSHSSNISDYRKSIAYKIKNNLTDAGYAAFVVDSSTYSDVQIELGADLQSMNLDLQYSYLIVGASPNNAIVHRGVITTYKHTYAGKTYDLRTLQVTSADDPAYGKSTYKDLLDSTIRKTIIGCINEAVIAYISAISKKLGTVASITGLDVSQIVTSSRETLLFHAATNWTREFTQVKGQYGWTSGSSVEYARLLSYMSGDYYDKRTNSYRRVPEDQKSVIHYSSYYNNYTWRKDRAVIGYLQSAIQWNVTGDIKYRCRDKVITHKENF